MDVFSIASAVLNKHLAHLWNNEEIEFATITTTTDRPRAFILSVRWTEDLKERCHGDFAVFDQNCSNI